MFRLVTVAAILFVLASFLQGVGVRAQNSETISLPDRVMMASQIYHVISTFFPGLSQKKFDADYQLYPETIFHSDERRDFDLKSMALVATLHDGHSWFL